MTLASSALGATVGLQGTALMGRAYGTLPPGWRGKKAKKGKGRHTKRIVGGFTDIMVGTALMGPTATMASKIS